MASELSIAIRKAAAHSRIAEAAQRLASAKGVGVPNLAPKSKDVAIQAALQVEAVADFLEALAVAPTEPEPETKGAAKQESKAKERE